MLTDKTLRKFLLFELKPSGNYTNIVPRFKKIAHICFF